MILLVAFNLAMAGIAFAQSEGGEKVPTYTISGSVGLGGVTMQGLPGNPTSDERGRYSATVDHGWSGDVFPRKEGYKFEPAGRPYSKVVRDCLNNNYAVKAITYIISGRVGVGGVRMLGLPDDPVSDGEGAYKASVLYGWAGVVEPTREGYTFVPPARNYTKVAKDLTNQDYAPREVTRRADDASDPFAWQPPGAGSSRSRRRGRSTGYRPAVGPVGSRKVLVVPAEQVNAEELAAITEDMQVMSYILDERFKQTRRIQGVFIDFGDFFGRDNRQTEATYLQGYGVLFSMEVNFSFSPPSKRQAQETEPPGEQVDSTWQRARRQVFSPGEGEGAESPDSAQEYNSRMVEELKRELITTLKHAANIRGLQPDEWVILTVIGTGRRFGGMGGMSMGSMGGVFGGASYSAGGGYGAGASGGYGAGSMGGYGGGGFGGSSDGYGGGMVMGGMMGGMGGFSGTLADSVTVLTIRAKKSDVDAFAGGQLDFDRFCETVKTVVY
jgi:hypothetical protein